MTENSQQAVDCVRCADAKETEAELEPDSGKDRLVKILFGLLSTENLGPVALRILKPYTSFTHRADKISNRGKLKVA